MRKTITPGNFIMRSKMSSDWNSETAGPGAPGKCTFSPQRAPPGGQIARKYFQDFQASENLRSRDIEVSRVPGRNRTRACRAAERTPATHEQSAREFKSPKTSRVREFWVHALGKSGKERAQISRRRKLKFRFSNGIFGKKAFGEKRQTVYMSVSVYYTWAFTTRIITRLILGRGFFQADFLSVFALWRLRREIASVTRTREACKISFWILANGGSKKIVKSKTPKK